MIIEWNTHLFSSDTERYPWHPQAAYVPGADQLSTDPLADYLRRMTAEGIDRAVVVHPEPYGDDHRLVLDALRQEPGRLRGTALFYPKDRDAPRKLRELVAQEPKIIAFRFHAHRGKDLYLDSFADSGVAALWETAADLGLIVELHIGPDFARQTTDLIRAHPSTPVLIDHLAEPHMGTGVEFADVLDLARFDNVYMKLSGLNHFATDGPLYESARPFTRWVVDAFGPARMVWGSGSPRIVDVHLAHLSEADRDRVKGGNLAELLHWT
ncbi:MAG: amidohydrolase family protein [Caldilineaceae bacterium]|nr:amidohydrolase family protein [Caldilineaceae bacterium]